MTEPDPQMILPMGYPDVPHPPPYTYVKNLRLADLVAKTARVTLKDTMRVILALDAVAAQVHGDALAVMASIKYDPSRPTPDEVAACERVFYDMRNPDTPVDVDDAERHALIRERLHAIRQLA